jgi:toxin ParE1/3/4
VSAKPVIPRAQANRDVDEALAHYLNQGSEAAALGFVDALEQAYRHVARHPASGSSRHAHELDLQGLKFWPLKRYPYFVFYIERATRIDVWRVLHAERDMPAWLKDPDIS